MTSFDLTHKAKDDLQEIAGFTMQLWGREQRNLYLKQMDDTFWLLSERPDLGKSCDDIRKGYRKFPQGSHVIFFKPIHENRIEIVRILHKNMDVDFQFGT